MSSNWTELRSDESSVTISNLIPCQLYEIRYKTSCQTQETDWSDIIEIMTRCTDAVANINAWELLLFPNPSVDHISLRNNGSEHLQIGSIEVFSSDGLRHYFTSETLIPAGAQIPISDFETWSPGIYFMSIRLKDHSDVAIQKIVKL